MRVGQNGSFRATVDPIARVNVASPTIESLLFRASAREALIYAGVVTVLLLVAIAASIVPSWRATRVDPAVALQAE